MRFAPAIALLMIVITTPTWAASRVAPPKARPSANNAVWKQYTARLRPQAASARGAVGTRAVAASGSPYTVNDLHASKALDPRRFDRTLSTIGRLPGQGRPDAGRLPGRAAQPTESWHPRPTTATCNIAAV